MVTLSEMMISSIASGELIDNAEKSQRNEHH